MGYTISFFNNGYGQNLEPLVGATTIPNLPILEEEGFIFEGWYLDEDLTVLAEVGAELISDITLYACWVRMRGYTNNNTYVLENGSLLGPDIGIKPDEVNGTTDDKIVFINSGSTDYYCKHPTYNSKWYITAMYDKSVSNFYSHNKKFGVAVPSGAPAAYLNTPAAIENWRTTVLDGYKYKDSDGSIKNISFPTRGSIPTRTRDPFYTQSTSGTVRLTARGTNDSYPYGFQISGANINTTNINIIEHGVSSDANNYIVPTCIIFELCAGGGGGGASHTNSRNGAGGAGGGFITGVLKLDFNKYNAYDFVVGGGGRGGQTADSLAGLMYGCDGISGGDSYIKGVKFNSDGSETVTTIVTVTGGGSGKCANDTDWSKSHTHSWTGFPLQSSGLLTSYSVNHSAHSAANGGSVTIHTTGDIYSYTVITGGKGGQTNGVGTCSGGNTSASTAYYAEIAALKTKTGMSTSYGARNGGNAGSSGHSGGGGASAIGSGGSGGPTASAGSAGNGPGAGGGGGRWTILDLTQNGADGQPGYLALYY